jgi:hypothetical protein
MFLMVIRCLRLRAAWKPYRLAPIMEPLMTSYSGTQGLLVTAAGQIVSIGSDPLPAGFVGVQSSVPLTINHSDQIVGYATLIEAPEPTLWVLVLPVLGVPIFKSSRTTTVPKR